MSGADHFIVPPHTDPPPHPWVPSQSDLKFYRHFDAPVSLSAIPSLFESQNSVLSHRFMPLLEFEKKWRRAPKNGVERGPKIRKIRFACRKDSYIYKHYRELLAWHYERILLSNNLDDVVLAYRTIADSPHKDRNKTNIEFARDAFEAVRSMGKCAAVAIDISKFFDSLDHAHVKRTWCRLIGEDSLPDDHYRVFRSIIRYRYISRDKAYVALNYSEVDENGVLKFKVDPKSIPIQICSLEDFRQKIVDADLVEKHSQSYGIPQGLPLSDVIANSYLIDFDIYMNAYAKKRGGKYMRYSDDILIILPGDGRAANGAAQVAASKISEFGDQIEINASKTEIACFTGEDGANRCYNLIVESDGPKRRRMNHNEGLSYLGFRFDGRRVFLRNGTVTNLNGKISRACRASAHSYVNRHKEKDLDWLLEHAPIAEVRQNFFKVKGFEEKQDEALENGGDSHKLMTFWSYAVRASRVFKSWDNRIIAQLRSMRARIDERFLSEIERSYASRDGRNFHEASS